MTGEWQLHQVADLIANNKLFIGDGYRAKNEELSSRGLPFARVGNINGGFQFDEADHFPEESLTKVGNKVSEPWDVVFTSKGTVGRFAIVRPDTPRFVYSPQLCFWRSLDTDAIDPHFLYYWMFGREFFLQFKGVAAQTDMAEYVSLTDQRRMHITLPRLNEQRAIAHILGTLDDKIELNRKMNQTLEAMARAIFKSCFTYPFDGLKYLLADNGEAPSPQPSPTGPTGRGRRKAGEGKLQLVDSVLGEIPRGWRVTELGDLIELAYGKALKEENRRPGNVPVFGSNGQVGTHNEKLVTGPGIVVGRKGNPGIVTWAPSDFFPIDTTFYVVTKDTCRSLYFLFYALQDQDLASLGADSAVPGLNRNMAYMSHMVVPGAPVLDAFDKMIQPVFERISHNNVGSRTLAALRDSLLPKLLSGEIRVKDAEKVIGRNAD